MKQNQGWLSAEMALPTRPGQLEEEGYSCGFHCIAGLDEVGRGPWAGPVVAGAVILPRGVSHPDIQDSKLLTSRKREALAVWIKERAVAWGLGIVSPQEIDQINVLKASLLAMAYATMQLEPTPDCLFIDGPHKIPLDFLQRVQKVQDVQHLNGFKRFEQMPSQRAIKKGDRLCVSIAAASIIAKVARDGMMREYDKLYPEYGLGQNKGYGSPVHLAALNRHGPSPIHRRSFRPVRECLSLPASQHPSVLAWKRES